MTFLNAKQLAFILDIEVQEAREKMVYVHCKDKGIDVPRKRSKEDAEYISDKTWIKYTEYPDTLPVALLAEKLNLPTLQNSVDDITSNYLLRPASKKYILCDYPEKKIKSLNELGRKASKISIPDALRSMLPNDVQKEILKQWNERYPRWNFK